MANGCSVGRRIAAASSGSQKRAIRISCFKATRIQVRTKTHDTSAFLTRSPTVISVAPCPTGELFATGSGDMKARIWRSVAVTLRARHPGLLLTCLALQVLVYLIVTSNDGGARGKGSGRRGAWPGLVGTRRCVDIQRSRAMPEEATQQVRSHGLWPSCHRASHCNFWLSQQGILEKIVDICSEWVCVCVCVCSALAESHPAMQCV